MRLVKVPCVRDLRGQGSIFATVLTYILMPFGLKRLLATGASIYMNLQPVTAAIAAIAVGQEQLTVEKPIATALVIGGALVLTLGPKFMHRPNGEESEESAATDNKDKADAAVAEAEVATAKPAGSH